MDAKILESIKCIIQDTLVNEIKKTKTLKQLEHNHPPLRFIVKNCEYCEKYGNVFSN